MKHLDELIAKLCPDGVEYRPLGDVCVIKNGKDYKSFGKGPFPVYGSGGIMTYVDQYVYDKPTVLIPRKGSIENLFYVDVPFWNVDTVFYTEIKTDVVVPKYLYYYMTTVDLRRMNNAGGVPSLTQTGLYRVSVAVPPLAVQKEIVRILDGFTELIDTQEEELAARKKQYEWCRDRLLEMKDRDVCYKLTLGEVCEVLDNLRVPVSKKNRKMGPYPYYGANGIQDYVDSYIFDGIFLLVGEDGSVINEDGSPILNWVEGKVWVNNHAHVLKETDKADLRYLFYLLQTNDISAMVRGTPPKLNQENLKRITVNLPPLPEQRRIVKMLDSFDTLCNSMKEGLPGEIALRKQQYEYYRDKLLTFKKVG